MITLTDEQWNRILALIPKLEQNKAAGIIAGSYLTDEQALTAPEIYPQFKAGVSVLVGERYRDSLGDLYKVVQTHITQEDWQPADVPALFVKVSIDEWPLFVQPIGTQDAYNTGNRITFENQHYISLIDNNVWSPTAYSTGWALQGSE